MGLLKDVETFMLSPDRLLAYGVPSISMAILKDPQSPVQNHVITKGRENVATMYPAAGISAAITSLAVAKLIDQGHFSYDTKIVHHIPEAILESLMAPETGELLQYVTVGLLVSHRSGLSQHGLPGCAAETVSSNPVSNTPRLHFLTFPGCHFEYSEVGYLLLQIFIEEIMGNPFADVMNDTVLHPLGMTRSRYGDVTTTDENHVQAYGTSSPPPSRPPSTVSAAASLWTTPSDLLKAVSAIQRSLHSSTDFLSPQTAQQMLTPITPNHPTQPRAMTWEITPTLFGHTGDLSFPPHHPSPSVVLVAAHTLPSPPPPYQSPGLISFALMTTTPLGAPVIRKITAALFSFRGCLVPDDLPCGLDTATLVPFELPAGVFHPYVWRSHLGHWTAAPSSEVEGVVPRDGDGGGGGGGGGAWEIYEDADIPMLAFEGVMPAARLRPGLLLRLQGVDGLLSNFVVEGLEMGVRMCADEESGESWVELVMGGRVTVLRRVGGR